MSDGSCGWTGAMPESGAGLDERLVSFGEARAAVLAELARLHVLQARMGGHAGLQALPAEWRPGGARYQALLSLAGRLEQGVRALGDMLEPAPETVRPCRAGRRTGSMA